MNNKIIFTLISILLLSACAPSKTNSSKETSQTLDASKAHFTWFDYAGNDDIFNKPLAADEFQNPILAGVHPDPSIVRVGKDYYLINSTFGFFPGIPIYHSTDLVNWTQIGNAIHRPEQMPFDDIYLTNNGVYAPAIEYRDGIFYIINTCVNCGGNFVVTATDPAGPWSDPIWMPHLIGIDPSIFFDDDGKTYVVHHRDPEGDKKRYPAHTALWVMEVDPVTFEQLSDDVMLVDAGDEAPWNTDYHEGPHIYKVDGTYYLSAPGGGTGYYHQQLIYRSDDIFGKYEPNPNNPILTQFGLPDDRENPVTATGHADMFEDTNGDWWAVFLATRIYDLPDNQDPGYFHTGRETFMLPVTWQDGWPTILEKGEVLPYTVKKPNLPPAQPVSRATTGNFIVREQFTEKTLAPHWLFVRTPHNTWWQTGNNVLSMEPRNERLGERKQPSFIGRRLAHMKASFSTKVTFSPQSITEEAGLLALQNDEHYYTFGLGLNKSGETVLRIRQCAGKDSPIHGTVLAEKVINANSDNSIELRMDIDKSQLDFSYSLDGKNYQLLVDNADAKILTSAVAGGFVGAVVGMYAEGSKE